jgi:hypothetical protein
MAEGAGPCEAILSTIESMTLLELEMDEATVDGLRHGSGVLVRDQGGPA